MLWGSGFSTVHLFDSFLHMWAAFNDSSLASGPPTGEKYVLETFAGDATCLQETFGKIDKISSFVQKKSCFNWKLRYNYFHSKFHLQFSSFCLKLFQ